MAFVPVPDTVEVFLEHSYNLAPGKGFVLHFIEAAGPWTLSKMAGLGTALTTWWNTHLKPTMHSGVILERIRMRDLTTQNGLVYDTSFGLPLVGTRAGSPTQSNVVISVKKNTGLAGKSFRGRVYHFGLVQADITSNFVSQAVTTLIEAAWGNSITLTTGADIYDQQLVSKYTNNQPRVSGVATPITSFQLVDRLVDTNRLKLPKR